MGMGTGTGTGMGTRMRTDTTPQIYGCELEAVPEFEGLQDFCQTFPLYQPGGHPTAGEDPVPVGEFKVGKSPRGTPEPGRRHPGVHGRAALAGAFPNLPPARGPRGAPATPPLPGAAPQPTPKVPSAGLRRPSLRPATPRQERAGKATHGCWAGVLCPLPPPCHPDGPPPCFQCDPYVRVSLGAKTLGQRDQYVPNTLEPVFGRYGRAGWSGGTVTLGGTGLGGPGTERRCPGRAGGAPFPMSACPHADLSLCHQVPMPLGLHATGSPRQQVPIPHNSRSLCHWMPRSPGPRATKMSHTPCWWVPAPLGRHATKSLCHQVPVPMGPHSPCQGVPGPRPARPRG